jgi:hypothetical protein
LYINKYKMYTIYKLTSQNSYEVYIGKTKTALSVRKSDHRSKFKSWVNSNKKKYCTAYEIIRYGDWNMTAVETDIEPDRSVERERFWIENTEDTVNHIIPGRTKREHYYDNQDKILASHKIYGDANRAVLNAKTTKYRANNKTKISDQRKRLKHCCMCSKLISLSQMYQHRGRAKGRTDKKCKEAQKSRKIIYDFIISKPKINQ